MDKVTEALNEEIISEIKSLSQMTDGCEAKSSAIDDLSALYKLRMEELKLDKELELKRLELEHEAEKAEMQKEENEKKESEEIRQRRKERIIGIVTKAGEIIIPLGGTIAMFCIGLKFEETGTFTSTMTRNLLHSIKVK